MSYPIHVLQHVLDISPHKHLLLQRYVLSGMLKTHIQTCKHVE